MTYTDVRTDQVANGLRVLLVEDSENDALLLLDILRTGGFVPDCRRVETEAEFRAALREADWDVMIADYVLPRFSGVAAIRIVREAGMDLPIIMVSGKVGEETAVEAMRAGAHDYLLKTHLARLAPVISRELAEVRARRRTETALHQAEQELLLLSKALESVANGVAITNRAGEIIWVNPAFTRLTGYALEEVVGRNPRVLKSGAHDPAFYARMWATILDGRSWHGQMINVRKDGARYTEEMTIAPVRADGGEITHFVAIKEDISARKRAEDERERSLAELDATISSIADGLILYSPSGRVMRMNAAARRMFCHTEAECWETIQARWMARRVRTPDGQPFPLDEIPALLAERGETVVGRVLVFTQADGTELWLSVSAGPVRAADGAIFGVVATYTDITEHQRLQARQEDMLRMISHDLRAPLTIIKGHVQLLESILDEPDSRDLAWDSLQSVALGVRSLEGMIRDLVDSARLEGGQLQLHRATVDLHAFLHDWLRRAATVIDTSRILLDCPSTLPPVAADENYLERIFTNLLSNALKYADPGTLVRVQVSRGRGDIEVAIQDRGPGIAPEHLPHLFDRYYRAVGKRQTEGIGLGLYITKMLVEAHDGHIQARSIPGRGSTFTFTLPRAEQARERRAG